MNMIARALQEHVMRDQVKIRYLSWDEHIQNHHTPYEQRPHRRVKHPWAGVLA